MLPPAAARPARAQQASGAAADRALAERPREPVGLTGDATRLTAIDGPVDRATYRLGPGDRIAVTLSGPVSRVEEAVVTAEGTLIVRPAVGLRVAGLSIDEAEGALRKALEPFYHDVTARLDLLSVRRFKVYVLGLVERPGEYLVDGATRASVVIEAAGGVADNASRRAIRIEHSDGTVARADLVKFLAIGDRDANPVLQDGDRIVAPVSGDKAAVRGSIARGGDFEVIEGETVADLVAIAGGTPPWADRSRVELRRFVTPSGPSTEMIVVDLDGASAATEIQPGDQVFVPAVPDYHLQRTVDVRGEVVYPGTYVIDEGTETLSGVIARAGGFTPEAAIHAATLTRTVGADTTDREFARLRTIEVRDMTHDEYEYFKLRSRERPGRVAVDFEGLFVRGVQTEDLLLRRGDVIDVPTATLAVTVSGQVASPGAIGYEEGRPVGWYIDRAGGYGWRAAKGKTRVIRAGTGEWVEAGDAKRLDPGDTIWVPEKSDRRFWDDFKEGLIVVGQIATIYLVIDSIANE
jgi:protein involved in polysaccharide export with SLBB domain